MEATRRAARAALLLLLTAKMMAKVGAVVRPEAVFADVFTRPFVPRTNASFECIRDGEIYLKALNDYTPWALLMYDSSVKIPSGLITGNHKTLGNFDECLSVSSNEHGFVGQACNVGIQFNITPNDDSLTHELDLGDLLRNVATASNAANWTSGATIIYEWIWCVPSSCNYSEVQKATEAALEPLVIPGRVELTINVHEKSCHTRETDKVTWDVADFYYIFLLGLFALIVVLSTGYDIASTHWISSQWESHEKAKQWKAVLTSFSLHKNGKELLQTNRPQGYLGCLDGLRFLSICWIIYGHTHYMEATSVKLNLADIPWMHHDWANMLVLNANIATDTFFLLSGVVLAYTELSKKERLSNWRFDVKQLWIRRYVSDFVSILLKSVFILPVRVTPAYAMMIGFYATLFYKFGTGPHWDLSVGINRDYCRENWWLNLIYLNNYINLDKMCMSQSWYLSVDMQLVWLSPLILYPMFKFKRRYFIIILNSCLLFSFLVPFGVTYILELPGTMLYYKEQTSLANVYMQIYSKVYCRFGTYVIGLGLGYVLYETRMRSVKIHTLTGICGWLIAIALGLSVLFGSRGFYFDDHDYNRLEASFYAGLHRQVFALSVSWIIFCCMHNYAGPVNHLLSWSGWVPFSKLTYCAYLSHYLFLISDIGSVRAASNLTRMNVVRNFLANLVFTLAVSALWYVCFERPFLILERVIFDRKRDTARNNRNGTAKPDEETRKSSDGGDDDGGQDDPERFEETSKDKEQQKKNSSIEKTSRDVYVIKPADDAKDPPSAIGKSGYVNINFYRSFDEHVQPAALEPTIDAESGVKSNESPKFAK